MSKAKHTQGKWEHCGSNGCKSIFIRHGGRQRTEICDTVGRNEPEDLANARLIAASPEMYDALRKVNNFISANMGKNYMVALLNREVPEINELIKKIEG